MNLVDMNSYLPYLRHSAYNHQQNRYMSISTNPKTIHSSLSIYSSKKENSIPLLIQLCFHSNENYAYRTMRTLLSSRYSNSPNVYDEFGCNLLMYTLRYQRYKLFEFLLNETIFDINLHDKDQQGNTILHYAILYGGNNTQIIDKLIEKYNKFSIEIDERNNYGFTPLLLAAFCGRYDLALSLLTETDASPFVRDHIQFKNIFDYIEIDMKNREFISQYQNNQKSSLSNSKSKRLHVRHHQTIHSRQEISFQINQPNNNNKKNFFETILPQAIEHDLNLLRSSIMKMYDFEYFYSSLRHLLSYLKERYPRIKTLQLLENAHDITITLKLALQQENSKTNVHRILNLFDPNLRPKVIPLKSSSQKVLSTTRMPMTFKRLGTKITTLTSFSRMQVNNKRSALVATNNK
ncbi:unnamed protein product [Rotaria sp. Silwood1]|nr:unnamed protein product [Rotaria sp. Silwood1]CAF3619865.1 unnamed protein product [Rotaria sp. Silwood1]CAF4883377.1 unnamed protein product [Rotaria sp. Silwood1]